jgi:GAF domain-containing protein
VEREALLLATLVELTDVLVDRFDVVDLLTHLTDRCVEMLDVSDAGILLADPTGRLGVIASSSESMRTLELLELQSSEGPCFQCFGTGLAVANVQLTAIDQPWPTFGPRALDAGFQSVSALPMRLRGRIIGALNLFRSGTGALSERDLVAAQALADVATISILQHRTAEEANTVNEQLSAALNSRIVIEQAKGMVAERTGLDMASSFNALRHHARSTNTRLSDLAAKVVSGTISPGSIAEKPVSAAKPRARS